MLKRKSLWMETGLFLLSSTLECRRKLKEVLDMMKEQAEVRHAE